MPFGVGLLFAWERNPAQASILILNSWHSIIQLDKLEFVYSYALYQSRPLMREVSKIFDL